MSTLKFGYNQKGTKIIRKYIVVLSYKIKSSTQLAVGGHSKHLSFSNSTIPHTNEDRATTAKLISVLRPGLSPTI